MNLSRKKKNLSSRRFVARHCQNLERLQLASNQTMTTGPNIISPDSWYKIISNAAVRREVTRQSHLLFFHIYFAHYVKFESAPFHKTLFAITEDESIPMAVIEA